VISHSVSECQSNKWGEFAIFPQNWLPWQRPLRYRKKRSRSIICTQNAFIRWKDCENRSSRSWELFSERSKKRKKLTQAKYIAFPASLPSGLKNILLKDIYFIIYNLIQIKYLEELDCDTIWKSAAGFVTLQVIIGIIKILHLTQQFNNAATSSSTAHFYVFCTVFVEIMKHYRNEFMVIFCAALSSMK